MTVKRDLIEFAAKMHGEAWDAERAKTLLAIMIDIWDTYHAPPDELIPRLDKIEETDGWDRRKAVEHGVMAISSGNSP